MKQRADQLGNSYRNFTEMSIKKSSGAPGAWFEANGRLPWEVIKLIENDGWRLARTRGSQRQFNHSEKPGLVTVSGKMGDELARGTLNCVLKQAGLKK